jgi:hypothetical protein
MRQNIGVAHARLLPATQREKRAFAAAGAIRQRRPRTAPNRAQPQTARTGVKGKMVEMGRKKLLNGRAPSRENAQDCLETATS